MAKATTHQTSTPTNLNIRTRSSTLYANAPILLASILLNFRRRPESHLQLQVSEKLQELQDANTHRGTDTGLEATASRVEFFIISKRMNHHSKTAKPPSHSATPELLLTS